MADPVRPVIGVVGAGTMGGGIALVAALAGYHVLVQDVSADILQRCRRRIEDDLARRVSRGRLSGADAAAVGARLQWVSGLEDLGRAATIIEAAPEDLSLKRDLFRRLDEICDADTLLASNTSSLSISLLGASTRRPERVVGMHFFNPPPVMPLVEIVRGQRTSEATVDAAETLARAFGKTPVRVPDEPGFLVNRIARPFYGEALRLVADGVAPAAVIDRIVRDAGAYRMGPLELLDLIGLDVSLAVTTSIYNAFFQDPRYRPHPLQQRMVDAGMLGRKSGRGFYEYGEAHSGTPTPAGVVEGPSAAVSLPRSRTLPHVAIAGEGTLAADLRAVLRGVGVTAGDVRSGERLGPASIVFDLFTGSRSDKSRAVAELELRVAEEDGLILTWTISASVSEAAGRAKHPERVVGFATLPPMADRRVVEIQAGLRTSRDAVERAGVFWRMLGLEPVEVGDGAGGVFPRIQGMLCHEAILAFAEGIGSPADIDTAMRLGLNYPEGPIARAEAAGLATILAIVEGLYAETGDPRYRPAPLLRRMVAAGVGRLAEAGVIRGGVQERVIT